MKTNIAILGAGNMATALAYHLGEMGNTVKLYCIEPAVENDVNKKHCNIRYLSGTTLAKTVTATPDIRAAVGEAKIVICAVPSTAVGAVFEKAKKFLRKDAIVTSISKGLDPATLKPVIMIEQKAIPAKLRGRVCTIGGPAVANEIAKGSLTGLVIAGKNRTARKFVAEIFNGRNIRTSETDDVLGVGLAAALKNAYAIALGFCDGLRYPTNTKAMVVSLSLHEMARIMRYAGAEAETATSLAGLGDLIVTGFSPHGRNRKYGEKLVRAKTNDPAQLGLTTVEGIAAAEQGVRLARKLKIKTPLLNAIHSGVMGKKDFYKPFVEYLDSKNLDLG